MQRTSIYVVRHGESVANRDDICGGNSPLTEKGRQQARETGELLEDIQFDAAYSSDLIRAIDTAAIIYGHEIPVENRLKVFRERNFGSLEDEPVSKWMVIKGAYEAQYASLPFEQRWQYEYADDIENDKVLCERFLGGLTELAQEHSGKTMLVVSSAGPVRVMLMKLGFAKFLTVGSFKNSGYVELVYDSAVFSVKKVVGVTKPDDSN